MSRCRLQNVRAAITATAARNNKIGALQTPANGPTEASPSTRGFCEVRTRPVMRQAHHRDERRGRRATLSSQLELWKFTVKVATRGTGTRFPLENLCHAGNLSSVGPSARVIYLDASVGRARRDGPLLPLSCVHVENGSGWKIGLRHSDKTPLHRQQRCVQSPRGRAGGVAAVASEAQCIIPAFARAAM